MALLLELFVSKEKYLDRINQLDVQLNRLNQIKDNFQSLINDMQAQVMGEDSVGYEKLKSASEEQIKQLEAQISNAMSCRGLLQKTVDQMDDNNNKIEGILDDTWNTLKNNASTAKEAAEVAAVAAQVAALV